MDRTWVIGDRVKVQLAKEHNPLHRNELATIQSIAKDGKITLKFDKLEGLDSSYSKAELDLQM